MHPAIVKLFFALLIGFSTATYATEKITLYGDDDYTPYSYIADGQFQGIYVDFIKQAAATLAPDYIVEVLPIPWKRGLNYLEQNLIFGLFPPYSQKERHYIQTYSTPLYRESIVLFCSDAIMQKPHDKFPDDYLGATIGVNLGFLLSNNLQEAAKQGKIKLLEGKGNQINIERLAGKTIDCYANDRLSVVYSTKLLKMKKNITPQMSALTLNEAYVLSSENAYIGYNSDNKLPYRKDFIERMNTAIDALNKAGVMDELINQHTQLIKKTVVENP
jgi:polar amino acid transport system substrate-binding protein